MSYVNGFVAAVPEANKEKFVSHAQICTTVFKEHGAEKVVDCWEDDVPDGEVTSFPLAVQRKAGEKIVFSWIIWPSKEACDAGMKKVMEDPRMSDAQNPMPFDGKRLIYGGFQVINEN